jgi:hypothetical protein
MKITPLVLLFLCFASAQSKAFAESSKQTMESGTLVLDLKYDTHLEKFNFHVLANDKIVDTIKFGQRLEYRLNTGKKTIQIVSTTLGAIYKTKKIEVDIKAEQETILESGFSLVKFASKAVLFFPALFLTNNLWINETTEQQVNQQDTNLQPDHSTN